MHKHINFFLTLILAANHLWAGDLTSLAEAKAMAEKTNRPILLDFMTDW